MHQKEPGNKEKIIALLRARLEKSANPTGLIDQVITDQQLAILLGELEVFQLELEMQNDELSASYQLLDAERAKFAGFFNSAPVGYFILNHIGLVEEANQTGLDSLQISKGDILGQRFQSFIAPDIWSTFYEFLHQMQTSAGKQNCELKLGLPGRPTIDTQMEGVAIANVYDGKIQYYITVVDVTEKNKLADQARRLQSEQQRLIFSATFKAQEKERNKISHALHDSVCQILYGIRLNMQGIQLDKTLNAEFKKINELLSQAISETRELSYELAPSVLRDFGFSEGIKEMIQRLSTPRFRIKSTLSPLAKSLHPELQLYLFRIIQELINNCIKHADSSEAEINVRMDGDSVCLKVSDNGNGFSREIDESIAMGSGVRSIKNRVYLLNGTMAIDTSKSGTQITIKFKNDLSALGLLPY